MAAVSRTIGQVAGVVAIALAPFNPAAAALASPPARDFAGALCK